MNGQAGNIPSLSVQKSPETFATTRQINRHSMEAYSNSSLILGQNEIARPSLAGGIHPSYSTNDVPTLKNVQVSSDISPPAKTHAQQHFHNHNASLGRIPPKVMSNRHSRELSGGGGDISVFQQLPTVLQASAAPFGPPTTATSPTDPTTSQMVPFASAMNFQGQPFYGGYGMQMMNSAQPMPHPMMFQNQMQMLQTQQNGFAQYPNYQQPGRFAEGQTRIMQQRRVQNGDGKFTLS